MSFVGNITAKESFDELISSTDSVLIDVRSSRELCVDGVAVLENHPEKLLFCEWRSENPQNEKRKFLDDSATLFLSRIVLQGMTLVLYIRSNCFFTKYNC